MDTQALSLAISSGLSIAGATKNAFLSVYILYKMLSMGLASN